MDWVPKVGAGVLCAALAVTFARTENIRKENYITLFTESKTSNDIRHPGNAFSSFAFVFVALWLARAAVPMYKMARQADVVVLVWLSVVSFRFHATELLWIETQDLWCVVYLCVSCLSRYVANTDARSLLFTWTAMVPLLLEAVAQPVGSSVVEQYYIGIIGVLVYLLLWFSQDNGALFATLLTAFVAKVADMAAAAESMHTTSPLNGTSAFHILTALALFMHYTDEVVEPPAEDEDV